MDELLIYVLRSGLCLAVFYLFFKLLLSRETLHRFNRAVLLGVMLLSFGLPLCIITVTRDLPAEPEAVEAVEAVGSVEAAEAEAAAFEESAAVTLLQPAPEEVLPMEPMELMEPLPAVAADLAADLPAAGPEPADEPFPWRRWVAALYLLGVAVMLGWVVNTLLRVMRIVRSGRRQALGEGMTLVLLPEAVTPFSWWRYVVLSEEDWATCGREILVHEQAHLRLHHSWDLLLTDLLGSLQWFNPAMWLLRNELRAIHEYEADEAVLQSGADARGYQLLLIKKAVGGRWCSVANSFNHSKLKNRITMMLQNRSSRWAGAKALAVLPLAAVALGAFAETVYRVPEDKGTQESEEIQIFEASAALAEEMPAEMSAPMAVPVEVREPALLAVAALPAGEVAAAAAMPLEAPEALEVPEAAEALEVAEALEIAEEPLSASAADEAAVRSEAPEAVLPRTAGAYDPAGLRARAKNLRKQAAWERRVAKRSRRWGHDSAAADWEQLAKQDEAQAAVLEKAAWEREQDTWAREQAAAQAAWAREQAAAQAPWAREQAAAQAPWAREQAAWVREQANQAREQALAQAAQAREQALAQAAQAREQAAQAREQAARVREQANQAREQALAQAAQAREQALAQAAQAREQAAQAREQAARAREQAREQIARATEEWERAVPFTVTGDHVIGRRDGDQTYLWRGKVRLHHLDRLPAGTVILLNGKPSTAEEVEGKRLKSVIYDLANASLICKR